MSKDVRIVEAMHFTVKENGVIAGACCKVNLDTNEVFDIHNNADFVPDKVDENLHPGDEYIVFTDKKQKVPIIVADKLTSDFEREYYYWRQGPIKSEKTVEELISHANATSAKLNADIAVKDIIGIEKE